MDTVYQTFQTRCLKKGNFKVKNHQIKRKSDALIIIQINGKIFLVQDTWKFCKGYGAKYLYSLNKHANVLVNLSYESIPISHEYPL